MGPVGWLGRVMPFVRVQLRATDALVDTGPQLSKDGPPHRTASDRASDATGRERTLITVAAQVKALMPELD